MEKQTQQTSSQPPIGPPKEKFKRKVDECNNSSMATLFSSNEQILSFFTESATTRERGYRMAQLRIQIEAKRLALKEMAEENKILLTSLSSIHDNNIREFIRYEQARIVQKRKEQHQQPPIRPKLLINKHGF
ncbi:hypothetical protein Bca4012_051048 [Brassica carinata]